MKLRQMSRKKDFILMVFNLMEGIHFLLVTPAKCITSGFQQGGIVVGILSHFPHHDTRSLCIAQDCFSLYGKLSVVVDGVCWKSSG
jgi:hypothetical protein